MASPNLIRTSNPKCEYSFSWEINNFHLTSLTVTGPAVQPIPEVPFKFYLEVVHKNRENGCNYLEVNFRQVNNVYFDYKIQSKITLSRKSGKICDSNSDLVHNVQPTPVNLISYFCGTKSLSDVGLGDGKWILAGTITFSNYRVLTNTCPLPVKPQRSLENHTELPKNLQTIYEGSLSSRIITFFVDEKELAAHKAILCKNSTVFEKMFEHDMAENNTNKVNIEDADFCTFNNFLVYLYTGGVNDDKYESLLSLYSVAKKYQVKSLQEICVMLLTNKLSVECVCDILVLAELHEDKELKGAAKNFVGENFLDIAGTTKWIELATKYPILTQEVLDYMKGKSK